MKRLSLPSAMIAASLLASCDDPVDHSKTSSSGVRKATHEHVQQQLALPEFDTHDDSTLSKFIEVIPEGHRRAHPEQVQAFCDLIHETGLPVGLRVNIKDGKTGNVIDSRDLVPTQDTVFQNSGDLRTQLSPLINTQNLSVGGKTLEIRTPTKSSGDVGDFVEIFEEKGRGDSILGSATLEINIQPKTSTVPDWSVDGPIPEVVTQVSQETGIRVWLRGRSKHVSANKGDYGISIRYQQP